MEAGIELDKLVAEKVMGLKPCNKWSDAMGLSIVHSYDNCDSPGSCYDSKPGRWNKKYSTDITSAWQVVEKLVELDKFIDVSYNYWDTKWMCYVDLGDGKDIRDEQWFGATTAQLAICLAALAAVGEKV